MDTSAWRQYADVTPGGKIIEVSFGRNSDGSLGLGIIARADGRPVISAIAEGSPAAATVPAMAPDDLVLAIDGTEVGTVEHMKMEVRRQGQNGMRDTVSMRLLRQSAAVSLQPTIWSAGAVTVAAGSLLDVPLIVKEPSLGTYDVDVANGGSVVFSVTGSEGLDVLVGVDTVSKGQGEFKVPKACVLTAHLDNTGALLSAATLACRVTVTPIADLAAAEAQHVRKEVEAHEAHLQTLAAHQEGLETQEAELIAALGQLRTSIAAVASIRASDHARLDTLVDALALLSSTPSAAAGVSAAAAMESVEAAIARSVRERAQAVEARRSIGARTAEAQAGASREVGYASTHAHPLAHPLTLHPLYHPPPSCPLLHRLATTTFTRAIHPISRSSTIDA